MIVGTAGHIDHGKTTLVRALTGVDTDRLPEEKRRGISIELGYAFLAGADGRDIGFIDVPGHERLVHTMLAGATGIDVVLLLVAADDGVMPQTIEHLAIITLLCIPRAALVVTKCDRVATQRIDEVERQLDELLAGTPLSAAPRFRTALADRTELDSDAGATALRQWLIDLSTSVVAEAEDERAFRLAVDRAFTLPGIGTVVTGSVHAGRIRVGDEIEIVPRALRARVRSVHAQNRAAESAVAGQRCALNLAGVDKNQVERGDWVCDPEVGLATDRLDVELRVWPAEDQPLRSGARVHLHLGASDSMARVILLDAEALAPGCLGRAQLAVAHPLGAWRGDRVVLRDAAAARTIAGGRVLDPWAPPRYRKTPQRLADLAALALATPRAQIDGLLQQARYGIDLRRYARAGGLRWAGSWVPDGCTRIDGGDACWASTESNRVALQRALLEAMAQLHAREPDAIGADQARLGRIAAPRADPAVVAQAVEQLLADARLERQAAFLRLPEHASRLSAQQQQLAQRILPMLESGGFDPPWVRDIARDLGQPEAQVRATLAAQARGGEVFQVVKDLFYHARNVERLAAAARELERRYGAVRAADFRDATGLGRKRAIQVLEFFDRVGLLRRVRDEHLVRPGSQLFGVGAAPSP